MTKPLMEPGMLSALWARLVGGTPSTGKVPTVQGDGSIDWQTPSGGGGPATGAITVSFDGAGAVVAAGSEHIVRMPYSGTITGAYLTGDGTTGSAVVDVRKSNRASIPPAASICASAKPTIAAAKFSDDTTLTGWTTTFADGDAITVHVESCAAFKKLELQLTTERL